MHIRNDERDDLGIGCNDVILETAVVCSAHNVEPSAFSPVRSPTVGYLPVVNAIVGPPARYADRVHAYIVSSSMLVDTASVAVEILIDIERRNHRSVGHNVALNLVVLLRVSGSID